MTQKKAVKVRDFKRANPSIPKYKGPGNKPGPKTVDVDKHKRKPPVK